MVIDMPLDTSGEIDTNMIPPDCRAGRRGDRRLFAFMDSDAIAGVVNMC